MASTLAGMPVSAVDREVAGGPAAPAAMTGRSPLLSKCISRVPSVNRAQTLPAHHTPAASMANCWR